MWTKDINHGQLIITWTMDKDWWEWGFKRRDNYWLLVLGPLGICHWYIYTT